MCSAGRIDRALELETLTLMAPDQRSKMRIIPVVQRHVEGIGHDRNGSPRGRDGLERRGLGVDRAVVVFDPRGGMNVLLGDEARVIAEERATRPIELGDTSHKAR